MSRPLLVLRAEPGASRTAARARALGLRPIVLSLFEALPVPWDAPDPAAVAAVAFTSAQAPRLAGPRLARFAGLPAYAVGPGTAVAARAAGFARVVEGSRDAAALGALLAEREVGPVLHLCGADHIPLLPLHRAVYEMRSRDVSPPAEAARAVALLHSAAGGRAFAALADRAGLDRAGIALAAISRRAADAACGGWEAVAVTPEPRDPALLAMAVPLCNNPARR